MVLSLKSEWCCMRNKMLRDHKLNFSFPLYFSLGLLKSKPHIFWPEHEPFRRVNTSSRLFLERYFAIEIFKCKVLMLYHNTDAMYFHCLQWCEVLAGAFMNDYLFFWQMSYILFKVMLLLPVTLLFINVSIFQGDTSLLQTTANAVSRKFYVCMWSMRKSFLLW